MKEAHKDMRILSIREQRKLSKYLYEDLSLCNLGILICMYTGLRIGEICALKWQDINLYDKYIYVNKTMGRIQVLGDSKTKTKIVVSPPKSISSIRKIPIPNEILNILTTYKNNPEAFLLTASDNKYIEPRNMENHFKAVIKKCGIENVTFHTLRHTFATRCVELGFDIKSLSEILGHASVNITLNRYVHPSMKMKEENMNRLSRLIRGEEE